MSPVTMPPVRDRVVPLMGGVDQVTPSSHLKPGALREGINWECDRFGGYRYPDGYERFDGTSPPSGAGFYLVALRAFVSVPVVGQTLTGLASGATGRILSVVNQAPTFYVTVYLTNGVVFSQDEQVLVGATLIGTTTTPTTQPSRQAQLMIQAAAADYRRTFITTPPGQGPVRGVVGMAVDGRFRVYAFRDELDANISGNPLRTHIYQSTPAGWVRTGKYMQAIFTNGSGAAPQEGQRIQTLQLSSVIKRVVLESGSWESGDAAGRFILPWPDNLFTGDATIGDSTTVTIMYAPQLISLFPGGRFSFDTGNFGGQLSQQRVYGADGVNPAFEFDGDMLVPIFTGIAPSFNLVFSPLFRGVPDLDRPTLVKVHNNHLFVTIGSSLFNSAVGNPYNWQALQGAAELATGDTITALEIMPGNQDNAALAVYGRNHTSVLYGTSAANWKLVTLASDTGAVPYSSQKMDQTYVLDDRGVVGFLQTLKYGNFDSAAYTEVIQPWIDGKRGRLLCSATNRSKGQLRYFFNDGSALYLTFSRGKLVGIAPMYFPVRFNCIWSGETESGQEVTYAGGTDGRIYQLDKGTSFDGQNIFTWAMTGWDDLAAGPNIEKSMLYANFEVTRGSYAEFQLKPEYSYLSPYGSQPAFETQLTVDPVLPQWDHETMTWDTFFWDGGRQEHNLFELRGDEVSIRYILTSNVKYLEPFTLSSLVTSYILRGRRYA